MKLLIAGDLHLGRTLSGLPERQAQQFAPSAAWQRLVDLAIDQHVSAVLLTGDVVDNDRVFFEAYGLLEAGINRLADNNIPVIAVAGNHDTRALPQLVDALDRPESLTLLGRNGTWGSRVVEAEDGTQATIVGWSFPDSHYDLNPLLSSPSLPSGANVIGLLHADLDQRTSRYAPVSRLELSSTGIPLWFLGHIHVPTPIDDTGIYYTGSLQGLDSSETGSHGAILLESSSGAIGWKVTRAPLATLRYEHLGPFLPEQFADSAAAAKTLTQSLQELRNHDSTVSAVAAVIEISGQSSFDSQHFHTVLAELMETDHSFATISLIVRRLELRLIPEVSLEQLAEGKDLCARLAETLLHLRTPQQIKPTAIAEVVREDLNAVPIFSNALQQLEIEECTELLQKTAEELLHELLIQRESMVPATEASRP